MFIFNVHVHVLERSGLLSSYTSKSKISCQFLFLPGTIQMEIFTISGFHKFEFMHMSEVNIVSHRIMCQRVYKLCTELTINTVWYETDRYFRSTIQNRD